MPYILLNMNTNKNVTINITSGTIVKTILFLLLFALIYFMKDLVLVILTAVVIASAVEPATRWFTKHRIPRVLAVIFVYAVITLLLVGSFFLLIPPILDETSSLLSNSPQYFDSIELWNPIGRVGEISQGFSLKEVVAEFRDSISNATGSLFQTISSIFGGVLNFILIIILSFYLSVQEYGIANFLKVITPLDQEKYIIGLWKRSQYKIGLWMQGQLLLAFIIGVLVYLGLTILNIKYAFLLALLAAIAELIPLFGPIIAAIPAIVIGFATGGTTLGLIIAGFYIIIQQFENHLIYPLVVKKVVGVPPLLVIIGLIVGAKLAGFLGLILSVPIAAAVMEFVNDIEKNKRSSIEKDA